MTITKLYLDNCYIKTKVLIYGRSTDLFKLNCEVNNIHGNNNITWHVRFAHTSTRKYIMPTRMHTMYIRNVVCITVVWVTGSVVCSYVYIVLFESESFHFIEKLFIFLCCVAEKTSSSCVFIHKKEKKW